MGVFIHREITILIEPSLVFENTSVDSSSHMDWPEKTGEYLVYIEELLGKQHFTEVFFRADTKKFYFHEYCELKNDLESYWRVKVLHWMILREMDLNEFEIH